MGGEELDSAELPTRSYQKLRRLLMIIQKFGAGNETRTRDLNLGKVALYQLSYSRILRPWRPKQTRNCRAPLAGVKKNWPKIGPKTLNCPNFLPPRDLYEHSADSLHAGTTP